MAQGGSDWLPPGQAETNKFPIVGETAAAANWSSEAFRLTVTGLVDRPLSVDFAELLAFPQSQREVAIHCVTGWSRKAAHTRGVALEAVLRQARIRSEARFVRFVAHSARSHDTSLPLDYALQETWLVHEVDGRPLQSDHGGPVRSWTPGRYFYKSLKWLKAIELLAEDRPGYWERESAYHNEADPWHEQRFDESRTTSREDASELRAAEDYSAFQGRVFIKARLGGWEPRNLDLSGLQLKYCSLRSARLTRATFHGSNLSLSNLEGADLRDAFFENSDLEGVSFAGADLRGARMHKVALSATRFFRDFGEGRRLGAKVEGLEIVNGSGLLEDQAAYLQAAGARIA